MDSPFVLSWSYAVFLLITGAITVGVVAGILRAWTLASRLLVLENAVAILEGTLQREVKVRAGMMRQSKAAAADELVASQLLQKAPAKDPWWKKYSDIKNKAS